MKMHGNMKCCTASLGLWMTLVLQIISSWGCSALEHDVAPSRMMTLRVWDIKGTCFFWNVFGFHPWNWSRIDVATYMFLAKHEAPLAVCSKQCIQRLEWLLGSRTAKSFNAFPVFHLLKPAFECNSGMALKEGYIDVQRQPVAKLKANCKIAGIKTEWTRQQWNASFPII